MATNKPVPKVFVFDLDGCCWDPEMYELWGGGAPFKADIPSGFHGKLVLPSKVSPSHPLMLGPTVNASTLQESL